MDTELIGKQTQWAYLSRCMSGGSFHHAYLFIGPKHSGGTTLMRACASALHPCETFELRPHDDERKRPMISVQQIRSLKEQLSRTAFKEGIRIVWVEDASTFSDESSNALLKILEEPPPHVIFLLRARARTTLLPTLVSRCCVISLNQSSVRDSKMIHTAQKRREERKVFINAPMSDRLAMCKELSVADNDEWLLEIEEAMLTQSITHEVAYAWYYSLITAQREHESPLREQSRWDAFCVRMTDISNSIDVHQLR